MPLFRINNKNVFFIHVPKTGGTSIETALGHLGPMSFHSRNGKQLKSTLDGPLSRGLPMQHFHARLLAACFEESLIDYAFMIVREPVSRLMSEYRHSRAMGRLDAQMSFSTWLQFSLMATKLDPTFRNNHLRPQVDFPCFNADVFHFEAGLKNCLDTVSARLGINAYLPLPHERKSDMCPVTVTVRDRQRIAQAYAADYTRFRYEACA